MRMRHFKAFLLILASLLLATPVLAELRLEPVQEQPALPQGLGWVSAYYVTCVQDGCYVQVGGWVSGVPAVGLNVRDANGVAFAALANGTPVIILRMNGDWLYVAVPCSLRPIGLWSSTAGVPLVACQE